MKKFKVTVEFDGIDSNGRVLTEGEKSRKVKVLALNKRDAISTAMSKDYGNKTPVIARVK